MPPGPDLPAGQTLMLPGRGRTWVIDSGPASGGHPLVLLHGWTSTAALNWYRCFPELAARYRVVALDHRGHGRGLRSRRPFTLEDCADDVAALVETLGVGPATLVGYSMGGPVAQLAWKRHPGVVREMVLCATAASFPSRAQLTGAFGRVSMGASLALSLLPRPVLASGMGLATRSWSAGSPWAAEEWRRHSPAALIQAGLALSRFDSRPWIGDVDVPTAIVVTGHDTTVSVRRQRDLADRVGGGLVFPVEGGHRVVVDQPAAFVPQLVAAVEAVRSLSGLVSESR